MNIWIQISLGLCPAVIFFLCRMIVNLKKYGKLQVFDGVILSVFALTTVAMLVSGVVATGANRNDLTSQQAETNIALAYAIADAGDLELATKTIHSMRASGVESSELVKCEALLYAARGNAAAAKALLIKANMLGSIREYDKLIALCDEALAEGAVLLGYDHADKIGLLMSYASNKIKSNGDVKGIKDAAAAMTEAEQLFDELLLDDNLNSTQAEALAKTIKNSCKKNKELYQIKEVRLCRLKLLVLAGNFEAIADEIDEAVSFDELAIVAELYINDLVDDDDFPTEYGKQHMNVSPEVLKQLKKVRRAVLDAQPDQEDNFRKLVERLDVDKRNPAISRLKSELRSYADDSDASDRSKAYMQLARMEYTEGNDKEASEHISSALNTVGMSNDENFYIPMIGLVDSITDKENLDKVKDVAEYAADITKNSSDYVVVKSIEKAQMVQNNNSGGQGNNEGDAEEERSPFEVFFADEASQKRNAFNITSVDATGFETVKLVVNVDPSISLTAEELKALIAVKDCNVDIEDFTVEKVVYSGADILLCCDTSGSMSGRAISDLQAAVKQFALSSSDIEDVALVPFHSYVKQIYGFGSGSQTIASAADKLYANGGTNMYDAILQSIELFTPKAGTLSFILLMSDGEDNTLHTDEEIRNNIGAVCKEKNIVLYALGLGGNVNVDYMNTLAASTGGYFVYINDSATLDNFYAQLRSQILNRYIITYKAKDTFRASRSVTIALKDRINNHIVSDTKRYSIYGTDADASQEGAEQSLIGFEGFTLGGLETNRIFSSKKSVHVNLTGTGLTDKMVFDIKLDGKLNYENIAYEFVNATTIRLTLPGGMACGVYDLVVEVDGKQAIFPNELTVSPVGTGRTTTFGNYIFTSDSRAESEDGILLSGYVTMNGWLRFNGDVAISGRLDGYAITVTDAEGSYIQYFADSATGLAKILAQKNVKIPMGALGSFKIYNDTYAAGDSPEHRVEAVPLPYFYGVVFDLRTPGVEIYPDKICIKSDSFSANLPLQDVLLSGALDDLFTFKIRNEVMLTNKAIDLNIEINNKLTDDEGSTYKNRIPANFGMMPIYTTPAEYEIKINTNTNEYLIDFAVKVAFIDSDGLGLKLEWGKRDDDTGLQFLCPKTVILKSDFEIKSSIGVVPVSYRDFKLGLTDIDPNTSVLNWKLIGSFDLESAKLSSLVPALTKYIKDPAILQLDDITATLSLGEAYVGIKSEAKLLEKISLAKVSIEAGKIPYKCELLGIYDEQTTYGMRAALTVGIIWETDNVDVNISGECVANLHSKFFGLEAKGICDLSFEWWIFEKSMYQEGRAIIGFMQDQDGEYAFVVKGRDTKASGSKEVYLYIDSSGLDCGTKKL